MMWDGEAFYQLHTLPSCRNGRTGTEGDGPRAFGGGAAGANNTRVSTQRPVPKLLHQVAEGVGTMLGGSAAGARVGGGGSGGGGGHAGTREGGRRGQLPPRSRSQPRAGEGQHAEGRRVGKRRSGQRHPGGRRRVRWRRTLGGAMRIHAGLHLRMHAGVLFVDW